MAKSKTFKGADQQLTTKTEKARFKFLLALAKEFYPEPVEDAFVSQYRESDGRLVIESIWMFTSSWAVEFKNALKEENFDLAILKDSITHLILELRDFDLKKAQESSRLKVHFQLLHGITGDFQATDANCLELLRITRERFLPNVMTSVPLVISQSDA